MNSASAKWPAILVISTVFASSGEAQTPPENWLAKPITFEFSGGPVSECVGYLTERYKVKIVIDEAAFAKINVKNVQKKEVKLEKMEGVPARVVLHALCKQIPATYKVEKDQIRITPNK